MLQRAETLRFLVLYAQVPFSNLFQIHDHLGRFDFNQSLDFNHPLQACCYIKGIKDLGLRV